MKACIKTYKYEYLHMKITQNESQDAAIRERSTQSKKAIKELNKAITFELYKYRLKIQHTYLIQ